MVISNKFSFGQIVYLKTDKDQLPRMVTKMQVNSNMSVIYELSCGTQDTWHFAIEIAEERDTLLAVS